MERAHADSSWGRAVADFSLLIILAGWRLRHWFIAEDAHWVPGLEKLLYLRDVPGPCLVRHHGAAPDPWQRAGCWRSAANACFCGGVLLMAGNLLFCWRPLLAATLERRRAPRFTSLFQGATPLADFRGARRWSEICFQAKLGPFGALASVAMVGDDHPLLTVLCVWVCWCTMRRRANPHWRDEPCWR